MLNTSTEYQTQDGRKVSLIGSKLLAGKRIFVGRVEGEQSYKHWDEDGTVFGDINKQLSIKYEANN